MEPKKSKIFSKETMQAVSAYCESEDIKDVDKFMYLCFKQGFDIKRYGFLGETLNEGEKDLKMNEVQEKWVEKEVIVEKRVEIPVEVIKEVEKIVEVIKEVIVEKEIIKEVPVEIVKEVEKIVTITNNEELEEKIFQLNKDLESERKIFSTKMEEMENNFQNEMSKKIKELDELRHNLDIIKENDKTKLLQDTLQKLRKEISDKNKKIEELEKINNRPNSDVINAIFMKGSNLKDIL
jgi:hypothetical protein